MQAMCIYMHTPMHTPAHTHLSISSIPLSAFRSDQPAPASSSGCKHNKAGRHHVSGVCAVQLLRFGFRVNGPGVPVLKFSPTSQCQPAGAAARKIRQACRQHVSILSIFQGVGLRVWIPGIPGVAVCSAAIACHCRFYAICAALHVIWCLSYLNHGFIKPQP